MRRLLHDKVLGMGEPRLNGFKALAKIGLCIDPVHVQDWLGNLPCACARKRPRLQGWRIILEESGRIRCPAFKGTR